MFIMSVTRQTRRRFTEPGLVSGFCVYAQPVATTYCGHLNPGATRRAPIHGSNDTPDASGLGLPGRAHQTGAGPVRGWLLPP